jgi:hypothetical protein
MWVTSRITAAFRIYIPNARRHQQEQKEEEEEVVQKGSPSMAAHHS